MRTQCPLQKELTVLAFLEPFLLLSGEEFNVSKKFLLLVLKCLKFNCLMLEKMKCFVLSRYPHSDPLTRECPK